MRCNEVRFLLARLFLWMQKQTSFGVALVLEFTTSFLVSCQYSRDFFLRWMAFSAIIFERTFSSQKRDADITFSTRGSLRVRLEKRTSHFIGVVLSTRHGPV